MSDHHYYYFHEDNYYHNDECATGGDDGTDQRFELGSWPDTCAETQYWDAECTMPVHLWSADGHLRTPVSAGDCQDQEEESRRCITCFDDLTCIKSQSLSSCSIACQHNHLICRFCLDRLILEHCSEVLRTPSTPSSINCPKCLADARFTHFRPTSVQNGNTQSRAASATAYTEEQLKLGCGGASKQALEMMGKVAAADQALAALSEDEQISKGNTDCYRCPKCQFGPVAHRACSNLATHHESGGINNQCPKCGFFGRDISEWIPTSSSSKVRPVRVVPPLHVIHCGNFTGFELCDNTVARIRSQLSYLVSIDYFWRAFSRRHATKSDFSEKCSSCRCIFFGWEESQLLWHCKKCSNCRSAESCREAENNLFFGNRDNNFHRHCLPKKRQDRIPRFQNTPRSSSRSAHRFGGR